MVALLRMNVLAWVRGFAGAADHNFLLVEVMWRETNRSELVQEYLGKSGRISRITWTVSTG